MATAMCVSTQHDKWELFEEYEVIGEPNEFTALVKACDGETWWFHKSCDYPGYHFARTSTGKYIYLLINED